MKDTCERCDKRPWRRQHTCPGDYGHHHHGMVHVLNDGLQAVCTECWGEIWDEWNPGLSRGASYDEFYEYRRGRVGRRIPDDLYLTSEEEVERNTHSEEKSRRLRKEAGKR